MKILHTSDWHLGRSLYGKKRYEEFEAFLNWLVETVEHNEIDALLVAGDLFDTSTPGNRTQGLYYRFLCQMATSPCRHVVIIAGNHDSPSFLDAPKELLKALDVHVIGSVTADQEDEVLLLYDEQHEPELIVCAVPFLRDRDIRVVEAGESVEDKEQKLIEGIRTHYAAVATLAKQKRAELNAAVPVVGMGHLFTAGGKTVDGDGVRELYVGSLAHVTARIFPAIFDYLALGHLHVPQKVGGLETIRYSGSPLPMGFGEANQQKNVCLVTFDQPQGEKAAASVKLIAVPTFQRLESVKGDWNSIQKRTLELSEAPSSIWLEVIYDGEELISDLRERLEAAISGTKLEILRIKNTRIIDKCLQQIDTEETLDDLNAHDIFERCLAVHEVPEEQQPELLHAYQEVLTSIYENDAQAE